MKLNGLIVCSLLAVFSNLLFAKEISMFDQPNANAKMIGKIDSANGIIPIYTPKDAKGWLKIADPHNGNVGWIKSAEMNGENVSIVQNVIMTPHIQTSHSPLIPTPPQFNNPPKPAMTKEEMQAVQRLESQQRAIEQSTAQLMRATARYLDMMFEEQARLLSGGKFNLHGEQPPTPQVPVQKPATKPAAVIAPPNPQPAY